MAHITETKAGLILRDELIQWPSYLFTVTPSKKLNRDIMHNRHRGAYTYSSFIKKTITFSANIFILFHFVLKSNCLNFKKFCCFQLPDFTDEGTLSQKH